MEGRGEFQMGFSLQNIKKKLAFIIVLILILGINSFVYAKDIEFMPVKDIKTGMKGFGKTVIIGSDIETFEVEVLGILSNNKINENLLITGKSILVKVSGDAISRAGGIAAGMSGSPVYVEDKLIGGISSGWSMTDHTVGLVTPIEEMIAIWDYPELAALPNLDEATCWKTDKPVSLHGKQIDTVYECFSQSQIDGLKTASNELCFLHASPEIFIDGLGKRAADNLKSKFKRRKLRSIPKSIPGVTLITEDDLAVPATNTKDIFKPGSAIGIQLARGDINLSTLGTLTHRDGSKILALAHPFLKKGKVSFLMTGAHIYHSFASVQMPFKIGAPTQMIGIITQDREKGISGEIGRFPEMVPVQIDVFDKDIDRRKSINYQIVRDPSVFNMVLESTLLQALEGVVDRDGAGTALLGISMECSNKEGEKYNLRRENMFYSKADISQTLINEITSLMEMVSESEIEAVFPSRLVLKVEVEKKRKTLAIEKVEIKNSSITSGGVLDVEISLRPFREKSFIRKVKIPIPQDIGKENLTLSVFGLNMRADDAAVLADPRENKFIREMRSEEPAPVDFDSAIQSWVNTPKNSDILFQLTIDGDEMKKVKLNGQDFEIQPTNLVVTGRVETTLTLSEE
jgi:hypothetical protein